MDDIIWFHDFLLWVITAIALFVLALLVIDWRRDYRYRHE
jgi:cytochrome c oxidase subunit 2